MPRCISPISLPNPKGLGFPRLVVPCGRCLPCLESKRAQWIFRIKQELKKSTSAFFVTMTYNDDHNTGDLCKRDIQLFLKKLRKKCKDENIRYYLIGEYGPRTFRPHYHCILFNLDPSLLHELLDIWGLGFVSVGKVTPASIAYVCKYLITKKMELPEGLTPVFAMMSLKPAIGSNYLKTHKNYHKSLNQFYAVVEGGHRVDLPRYYKDRIFNKFEKEFNNKKNQKLSDKKRNQFEEDCYKRGESPFLYDLEQTEQMLHTKISKLSKSNKL